MLFQLRKFMLVRVVLIITLLGGLLRMLPLQTAQATTDPLATPLTLTVNNQSDAVDANPGNGVCEIGAGNGICTLRAAIQETNARSGADTILIPAGIYTLTLPGDLDEAAAQGDLNISGDLTISGASAASTIIDGNGSILHDRVFNIMGAYHVDISNVTIRNGNPAPNNGGGIYNSGGVLNLDDVILRDNIAGHGAGLLNVGTSYLSNTTVSHNIATDDGGGIRNDVNLTIINSTINDNSSVNVGGGILNHGSLTLINSTIDHNQTGNLGGGIYMGFTLVGGLSSVASLSDTTITNNIADSDNNGIGDGGGIYKEATAIVNLTNTIVAGNTNPSRSPDCYGDMTSYGYNLIQNMTGCTVTGDATGNLIEINPELGPLQNNGGPTQTIALLQGSPAIDAGDGTRCPDTDQRGVARPQGGHCDIGAFEYEPASMIRFVKWDATGTNDGTSWANAYTDLRLAILAAPGDAEFWVAKGIYKPTSGTDRNVSFKLENGLAVYGGFAGTEISRDQRDPALNTTILSGDLGLQDNKSDNSYHVVSSFSTDSTAVLDGFTIMDGNTISTDSGGGIYNSYGSPTLANLTIQSNTAGVGGGMYSYHGSPALNNIIFNNNSAPSGGGGGMFNHASSPVLTNVTFVANFAGSGGGMDNDSTSNPILTNVTFKDNRATTAWGGGMYSIGSSNPIIRNTIFWGNTAVEGNQIYNYPGYGNSTPTISNSVVQGGCPTQSVCSNLITTDPLLGALGNYGGATQTIPLQTGSSAIDAGNDSVCPATDQRGMGRPQGNHCDIGAFEYAGPSATSTAATWWPSTPTFTPTWTATTPTVITTGTVTRVGPSLIYVNGKAQGANNGTSWTNAYTNLQSALAASVSGDEIWVAAGTYTPGTQRVNTFQLKSGVAVYGGFAGTEWHRDQRAPTYYVATLSGDLNGDDSGFMNNSENVYRVVTGAAGATLDGFTIMGGNANFEIVDGAGLYNHSTSTLTLSNIIFTWNWANRNGGGLYDYGSLTLTNVTFMNNWADKGGGLYDIYMSGSLTNVRFRDNQAADGGGMYNLSSNNYPNTPTLTNVDFNNNSATNQGGGFYNDSSGPQLTSVRFSNNVAMIGGGLYSQRDNGLRLVDVTFDGNYASTDGGGMYNYKGNPKLTQVMFSNNTARGGGGLLNISGNPVLAHVIFRSNSADYGGGLENYNGSNPSLMNVTFYSNLAAYNGGGMYNTVNSNPTLTNITFSNNLSSVNGGGMFNNTSSPTLTNVTFSGNSATTSSSTNRGGGIYNLASHPMIRNTIFWGNTSPSSGAQIYNDSSSSSLISDSVVQDGCPEGSACTGIITDYPLLGSLGNYGGFTQTIPINAGSSAIDTGNDAICPATDQRGVTRPQGNHCDIGAYEYPSPPVTSTAATWWPSTPTFTSTWIAPTPTISTPISPTFQPSTPTVITSTGVTKTATAFITVTPSPFPWTPSVTRTAVTSTVTRTLTNPPVVSSIRRINLNPTSLADVSFEVTFSKRVINVYIDDFKVTTTGIKGASVTNVSGSNDVYRVTVHTGSGNGTIRLDVSAQATITDLDGHSPANLPFLAGDFYTVKKSADLNVYINGDWKGSYALAPNEGTRQSYNDVNNGPVKIVSTNNISLIGAERVIYKVNGVNTSFSELMALPNSQLDTTYWLPWYNNADLDTQLRLGNVSDNTALVRVYVGGREMSGSPFTLTAGESTRISFARVNNGPVHIVSNVTIVASERVIYKTNGVNTSFTEMMALPNNQLTTMYWLPWYNNVDLNTQLRLGNVSSNIAQVHVIIGNTEMEGSPFLLTPGQSTRVSFAGINNGPVKIQSDQSIVAAERIIYKVNGVNTSFTELMALPDNQLSTTYWLPWYNDVDLDTQLRFGNVSSDTAHVHVYIGGVEIDGSPLLLQPGQSTRQSFPSSNGGPVKIESDRPIMVSERVIYKVNNMPTSFSELMGLSDSQLNTTFWLPWYNDADLDTQLRFGVP